MERVLTLHFIDGSKLSFDFPEQSTNLVSLQPKVVHPTGSRPAETSPRLGISSSIQSFIHRHEAGGESAKRIEHTLP